MMGDKMQVNVNVGDSVAVLDMLNSLAETIRFLSCALAAVPWPALRNVADFADGGDGWNRPASLEAWDREWEGVRQEALRSALHTVTELARLRAEVAMMHREEA